MQEIERGLEIERGTIDLETGEFPAILASSGEATDGHIIDVDTLRVPERMPLLFSHKSTETIPALGSVFKPTKSGSGADAVLHVAPRINMNGDDPLASVRRGIAQLMHDGDINAMSGRFRGAGVARSGLPAGHYARAGSDAPQLARMGMLIENGNMLEGSVVAIGADPKALAARADGADCEGARIFWRAMAREAEANDSDMAAIESGMAALRGAFTHLREAGCSDSDIVAAMQADCDVRNMVRMDIGERVVLIPRDVWDSLRGESIAEYRAAIALHKAAAVETVASLDNVPTPPVEREPAVIETEAKAPVSKTPEQTVILLSDFMEAARQMSESVSADVAKQTAARALGRL